MPVNAVPSAKRAALRLPWATLATMMIGLLAGCQGATKEVLDVEPPKAGQVRRAAMQAPKPQETIGVGPTRIGLVTALMATTGASERERDVRDGALLALDELGGGELALAIENTDGSPQQLRDAAQRLASQDVKLVAVSATDAPIGVVREGFGAKGAPILALRNNALERPAGTFSFVSDRIDSAVEGASYAAASGRTRLVVLSSADLTATESQRLASGLASYNIKPLVMTAAGADPFSGDANTKAGIKDVDSVLLVGAGDADVGALSRLRAGGYLKPDAIILGSSGWSSAAYKRPELAGSHLCLFGPENGSRMTASFRQRYERPADVDAAYGFDVVALAAGLARTQNENGINEQTMKSPAGFLGAAAAFRFDKDGSVRRTCAIHQVAGGSLKLVDPAPRSF
ncbi:ABC transporter substrate-binding protein [Sinorhizobium psoraleae]|uniref:ABC transporter substrate-binding protein n=1 Tax=Sinorhizobium psoraleae TaxID=520838 RepID=A0ABT4KDZ0_9HYPH|nr:ABC transporter substrate-binding protein [Sinorhizobium psoraleae]MCZ4089217.1 ABC transporter substrate-binding protein [Sinorhizobium psoraleae]